MEIKRENLPESLRWMHDMIFSTERGVGVWPGSNPFAVDFAGRRFAVATDGSVLVAVPCDDPIIPQRNDRRESIAKAIQEAGGGEAVTIETAKLKQWAGMALGSDAYFDDDGCGPFPVPNYRPCLIWGGHFDANRIAHALGAFNGPTVAIVPPKSRLLPVFFRDTESGAFAVVMPRSDVIPSLDDAGMKGGFGLDGKGVEREVPRD